MSMQVVPRDARIAERNTTDDPTVSTVTGAIGDRGFLMTFP